MPGVTFSDTDPPPVLKFLNPVPDPTHKFFTFENPTPVQTPKISFILKKIFPDIKLLRCSDSATRVNDSTRVRLRNDIVITRLDSR